MKTKQCLPEKKRSPAMTSAKALMLVLTAIYPLFMTVMTGLGLLYNRTSYGSYVTGLAVLLILSGTAITAGALLTLPRKKLFSLISLPVTICSFILFMAVLNRLTELADKRGWQGSGKYIGISVSNMYKSRLMPVIFPAAAAVIIALIQYFSYDDREKKAKKFFK